LQSPHSIKHLFALFTSLSVKSKSIIIRWLCSKLLTALSYSPLVIEITPRPHFDSGVAAVIELKYSSAFCHVTFYKCTESKIFLTTSIILNSLAFQIRQCFVSLAQSHKYATCIFLARNISGNFPGYLIEFKLFVWISCKCSSVKHFLKTKYFGSDFIWARICSSERPVTSTLTASLIS